ncbi:MAG TPA: amidohydrolase [Acidobacteriota bacterium]|nr:amidohydrolase [Acidobacteriota bacterium]
MRRLMGLVLLLFLAAACGGSAQEPADMVLKNGKIATVDEDRSEVQALAARDGKIVALGSDAEMDAYLGPSTQVIDLQGRRAIPGFIEGHGHFMGIGDAQLMLDLTQPKSWQEIVDMVAEAVEKSEPGEWILGRGFHQDKWDSVPEPNYEGFPYHDGLSKVSPDNPVMLTHASGHAAFVNAKALEVSGVNAQTKDPQGGEILRDSKGKIVGLLRETAQRLMKTPGDTEEQARKMAELAAQECLRKGITSFQDAGSDFQTIDLFKKLVDEGKMPLRLWVMIRSSNQRLAQNLDSYRMVGYGDDRLTVRAIKVSIDGALGSRGAWLLEPYSDAPKNNPDLAGLNLIPMEQVRETAELAVEHDYQLCIHAIGDRGNREVLNLYEETFRDHPDKSGLRWRIEHAQHLHPDDIPRFAALDVIASMQAVHATSDGPWVPDRLGEKRSREGAYMWKTLMESGAVVTNGTDAPVEDVSPIASYYSAVSRMMVNGKRFYPDERLNREEALRTYTINNAYAAFQEDIKGSLEVGKLADVTVLSKDILEIPEEEIPTTLVDYTIVGGEIGYERK